MIRTRITSILLIVIGFFLECINYWGDVQSFEIKFWLIGGVFILFGLLGLLWSTIVPFLENRAKTLGQAKKESIKRKSKS